MKDVTLLVTSCDKYEDTWHPFFELLFHYAKDFDYPIVLNTETKSYQHSHFNVRVINSRKEMTWSERLKHVLTQIDTEFVFLVIDDYFLKAPFGYERFEKVLDYLRTHKDTGVVDIGTRWASNQAELQNNIRNNDIEDSFFVREKDEWNITLVPTVWRRKFLIDLLRSHEDVWMFEYYSGIRAKATHMKVVRFITRMPTIWEYDWQVWIGMGITRGQWLPRNIEFFKAHGITVNFDRLGILNVSSSEEIEAMNKKSIKSIANSIKRRINRFITKRKSLS